MTGGKERLCFIFNNGYVILGLGDKRRGIRKIRHSKYFTYSSFKPMV